MVLSVMLIALSIPVVASAGYYGNCGTNLVWVLEDGTLTISGTGAMDDFSSSAPWKEDCDLIENIVIKSGVTSIGSNAFRWCDNLNQITIPDSVTNIGFLAFSLCKCLTSIDVAEDNANYSSVCGVLFNKDTIEYLSGKI